ncbi:MAG: tyrosine-type recombinase/integrase [Flavobacterium sp.]
MTKNTLINNVLLKMDLFISKQHLIILEKTLMEQMVSVDIVEKETALATELDSNEYFISMMLFKMKKKDLSKKTISQYERAIRSFNDFCNKNITKVGEMDIDLYLSEFAKGKKKANSNRSINNERKYLSACFRYLRKANIIQVNPVENVESLKEIEKPIEYLDRIEVEKLRDYCSRDDLRERALIEFLLSTACRIGEVEGVKVSDMDLRNECNVLLYGSKGRAFRYSRLNDTARYHIKKYLNSRDDDCPYLFVSKHGEKHGIKSETLREIIKKIKVRAEMQRRVYPHLMRKSAATDMREHGAAVEDIAAILGHKEVSTTVKYYAAVSKTHIRDVHRQYASY